MKKLLIFIASLLSISQINSQTIFNKSYHDVSEMPNPFVITIHNDLYFTTRNLDPGPFGQSQLYKHTNSGNLVYRKPVNAGFITNLGFKSSDNKLILVGNELICDVVGPTWHISLTKLDTNGTTVLFSTSVTATFYDVPKAALQKSDSSFAVFTDSLLYKFSKTGQFISKINLGCTTISSALALGNNNILLSCNLGSSHVLAEISSLGTLISSNTTSVLMNQLSFFGGQKIIGLGTDGVLYKYSPARNLIASSSFTGGLLSSNFICSQDTIYSLANKPNFVSSYMTVDTSFNLISLTGTSTNSINQVAICMNGSNVAVLASGIAGSSATPVLRHHTFSSLSSINKFSGINFENDLEFLSFSADSTKVTCYFSILPPPGEYHCSSYLRPRFTVKNKGTRSISSFKLNCYDALSVACGTFYYQELFSGFNLLPGDSITLTATRFARNGFGYSGVGTGFSNTFCFYISLPNGETDKTLEDNEVCGSYNFLTTGLKQNYLDEIALRISPNPFTNNLKVESDELIKELKIMNSLGMLVKRIETKNKEVTIDNSDLASGIYFISIETEKGIVTKKVIKQ